jgi:hypothetical protein
VCKTKTYFPPERKTDTTAQLEKKFLQLSCSKCIVLALTRAFWRYPICRGPLDQSGLGSGHPTTWAWVTLQLVKYELQYVLQHIVINKIIAYIQLIVVFLLHFSVALAQKTQLASQPPQQWLQPAEMVP